MSDDKKLTQVIALERGHDGDSIRNEGDVFFVDLAETITVPGEKPGTTQQVGRFKGVKWFVPVGSEEAKAAKTEPATGAGRGKK